MAGTSTLMALKLSNEARQIEERKVIEKKRNSLLLVSHYLSENGYSRTAATLQQEASSSINNFELADNIDLATVMTEFEAYYELRFGKKPKLSRKKVGLEKDNFTAPAGGNNIGSHRKRASSTSSIHSKNSSRNSSALINDDPNVQNGQDSSNNDNNKYNENAAGSLLGGMNICGKAVDSMNGNNRNNNNNSSRVSLPRPILKPMPDYYDPEMKALALTISRDICKQDLGVQWEDIIGHGDAKRVLREAVVMPLAYPSLFKGLLSPWGGVLLYGPPGTGKTMLAKAVASQARTTFFNISASSIVSKYRGDSEKLVRTLFDLARYHAPSTIFIDEIDAIMGKRAGAGGGNGSEHEGSLRMKTELLIQMDGLNNNRKVETDLHGESNKNDIVLVLAASNLPWSLDEALLRRMEKRVLVPLPTEDAREDMLKKLLSLDRLAMNVDLKEIAQKTEGFSGSDIRLLCKEAAMKPVRRLLQRIDNLDIDSTDSQHTLINGSFSLSEQEVNKELLTDKVSREDIDQALESTRPSTHTSLNKYVDWQKRHGAL